MVLKLTCFLLPLSYDLEIVRSLSISLALSVLSRKVRSYELCFPPKSSLNQNNKRYKTKTVVFLGFRFYHLVIITSLSDVGIFVFFTYEMH